MSELVLGPVADTRAVEMTTIQIRGNAARLVAAYLDALAAAWRDDPGSAFEWMVDNGIAYLNAPYNLKNAGWVVTVQHAGDHSPGRVVLST